MQQRLYKTAVMVAHDLVATAAAVVLTFLFRFHGDMLSERLHALPLLLPPFLVFAALVYGRFRLYRTKWRFASLPDLAGIVRAASVLALALLVTDWVLVSSDLYGFYFFGKIAIALYWVLQVFLLGGSRRGAASRPGPTRPGSSCATCPCSAGSKIWSGSSPIAPPAASPCGGWWRRRARWRPRPPPTT